MTIIGVAAARFRGIDVGVVPAFWVPASMSEQVIPGFHDLLGRRTFWMQILGRLRTGLTAAQAQAGLQPWFKAMLEEDTQRAGFPKVTVEDRRLFLASTLQLTPAPNGHSRLRRDLSQPLWYASGGNFWPMDSFSPSLAVRLALRSAHPRFARSSLSCRARLRPTRCAPFSARVWSRSLCSPVSSPAS
jgi:hypothetical protein